MRQTRFKNFRISLPRRKILFRDKEEYWSSTKHKKAGCWGAMFAILKKHGKTRLLCCSVHSWQDCFAKMFAIPLGERIPSKSIPSLLRNFYWPSMKNFSYKK